MSRPITISLLLLALLAAGFGGYRGWSGYAARSHWREIRPALPMTADEATAPGFAARLTACAAKIENWPPDHAALAEFSQLCHANGFLPEAEQGYRALVELAPTEGRWPHLLAAVLSGLGRLDEALPFLQRVTELAPEQTIGWLRLGDAQLKLNHTAEAERSYQAVVKREEGNVHALFGLARCDLQAGRLTAARSRLQQAVAANPGFPGAQSLLAMVFDQLGNAPAADLARKRVTGDGRYTAAPDPWALDLLAYCHNPYTLLTAASAELSDGTPKQALPLLHRALLLTPGDARLHRQLGNTLYRLGDRDGAAKAVEQALTLAPNDEKIRMDFIKLLREAKEIAKLEQVVLDGTKTNPDSAGLNYEAGKIAERAGQPEQAIGYLQAAWKLRPAEIAAPCELATVYFGSRRAREGFAVLEEVLQTHPTDPVVLTLLIRQGIEAGDTRTGAWLKQIETSAEPSASLIELRRAYQRRFGVAP